MYRHLVAFSLLLASFNVDAAVLTQVKGDQVLIDLQGDSSYTEGGRYLVMVGDKKKAVVEISKVKGSKALGKVLKGTAQVQGTLAPLPGAAASSGGSSSGGSAKRMAHSSRHRRGSSSSSMSYGVLGGYGITSQTVAVTKSGVSESVAMNGNSMSLKGFVDLPISGDLGVLGRVGFENFGVTGNSPSLGAVETKILYLSADLLLRYNLMDGNFRPFPLLGMGLHYPLSKSSGVLDVQRISATTIFFVGGGFNYSLSNTMYLHATGEYGIFPPSNDVKTSLIAIRAGVGFTM